MTVNCLMLVYTSHALLFLDSQENQLLIGVLVEHLLLAAKVMATELISDSPTWVRLQCCPWPCPCDGGGRPHSTKRTS